MPKSITNMMLAVIIGGIATEFLINRTPLGDFID